MHRPLHVACSPITGTIFTGHVLGDGLTWGANKTDVTGQACAAVAHKALMQGGEIIVRQNGQPKFKISVELIEVPDTHEPLVASGLDRTTDGWIGQP